MTNQFIINLVGYLIKLGGVMNCVIKSIKSEFHYSGKTKNHRAHEVLLACQLKRLGE